MKSAIYSLLIVSALLLEACSQKELLVYAVEPYWESADADGALGAALYDVARARGLRIRLVHGGINDSVDEVLSRELSRARAQVVVTGPFFSAEAADLAPRFPSVLFILMGNAGGGPRENVVRLLFDRGPAFRIAGQATALVLDSANAAEYAGRDNPSLEANAPRAGLYAARRAYRGGAKAGVILGGPRGTASADVTAFASGLKDAGRADRLVIKDLGGVVDAAAVQRVVNEMRAAGVEIFLPKLGAQNQDCLDAIRASGGCVVTEDWRATKAFEAQVFLSVEEDVAGGVAACLYAAPQRPQTVYGPVRLACGKALAVPRELEDKISCR